MDKQTYDIEVKLNPLQKVLFNENLLEIIFTRLNTSSLKSSRLVCQIWDFEARRKFPNPVPIFLTVFDKGEYLSDLVRLVTKCQKPMELTVSLFSKNWIAGNPFRTRWINPKYDEIYMDRPAVASSPRKLEKRKRKWKKFYNQQIDLEFTLELLDFFKEPLQQKIEFSTIGSFIVQLSLETKIVTETDAQYFVSILKLKNLQRLSVDFIDYDDNGILTIKSGFENTKLNSVGFRFHLQSTTGVRKNILLPNTYHHLLKQFENVEYIDLDIWELESTIFQDGDQLQHCLNGLVSLNFNSKRLKGLKVLCFLKREFRAFKSFSEVYPLTTLYLATDDGVMSFEELDNLVGLHSTSLKFFHVSWNPMKGFTRDKGSIPYLPKLEILSKVTFYVDWEKEDKKIDIFNLRLLIMDGTLKEHLPSLHTLQLIFGTWDENRKPTIANDSYEFILPSKNENDQPCSPVYGVSTLVTCLNVECESEKITRFLALFPDLKILRHILSDLDQEENEHPQFIGCEHRYNNGVLISNRKLAGDYFYIYTPPYLSRLYQHLQKSGVHHSNFIWI